MQASAVDPAVKSITFDVGGMCYPLLVSDIEKFSGSFFETAIKKEWLLNESVVKIQRDGLLFRYVHAFLVSGALPRTNGKLALSDEVIEALKQEADFFNLPSLLAECNIFERPEGPDAELRHFRSIQGFVGALEGKSALNKKMECEYPTSDHVPTDLVFLLGKITSPFCVQGKFSYGYYVKQTEVLHKSSTLGQLNIPELLAECEESAFGRGTETVLDPTVRKSFEIPASKLKTSTLDAVIKNLHCGSLAPNLELKLCPYKLVIYQEGGHFDDHRDTVRGDGHIGTLVLILNSEYTGGELEITHNGQTEVVTGPYSWVAMYGDCLHKINPVTPGTRVSLIFDIYATRAKVGESTFWDSGGYRKHTSAQKMLGVTESTRDAILEGIAQELAAYDTLTICLAHKYPLRQAVPDFLKGADRALYELVKDVYDAQVVACTVNMDYMPDDGEGRGVTASLFTSFTLPEIAESDDSDFEPAAKRAKTSARPKFLIPAPINAESVLAYTPYLEYTGNEAQTETAVYLVSGLQLRKRA